MGTVGTGGVKFCPVSVKKNGRRKKIRAGRQAARGCPPRRGCVRRRWWWRGVAGGVEVEPGALGGGEGKFGQLGGAGRPVAGSGSENAVEHAPGLELDVAGSASGFLPESAEEVGGGEADAGGLVDVGGHRLGPFGVVLNLRSYMTDVLVASGKGGRTSLCHPRLRWGRLRDISPRRAGGELRERFLERSGRGRSVDARVTVFPETTLALAIGYPAAAQIHRIATPA